jgi:hypothetical protein
MRISDLLEAKELRSKMLEQPSKEEFVKIFKEHMERLQSFYEITDKYVEEQARLGVLREPKIAAQAICRALIDLIDEALAKKYADDSNASDKSGATGAASGATS